jgi:hypothetical protein
LRVVGRDVREGVAAVVIWRALLGWDSTVVGVVQGGSAVGFLHAGAALISISLDVCNMRVSGNIQGRCFAL